MDFDEFLSLIEKEAERENVESWELVYSVSESLSLSAFQGKIDSFSSQVDSQVSFRAVINKKEGSASADSLLSVSPKDLIIKAKEYALNSDNENISTVFEGCDSYPEKKPYSVKNYTATEARLLVLDSLSCLLESDERIADTSKVFFDSVKNESRMANSHGLKLKNESRGNALTFSIKAEDGDDVVTAYKSFDSDFDLIDYNELSSLCTDQLGARKVDSGVYKVILSPKAVSSLLSAYKGIFTGKANELGLAKLKDREGELVASPLLTLIDDPLYPGYSFQRTFDGDGRATREKSVIENGVLKTLLYNNEWALKCNKESTGNGRRGAGRSQTLPYTFYIQRGETPLERMLEGCGDGILVDNIKGLHAGANSISGEFSLESSGFMIEEGRRTRAVKGFTIAGNFYELLENIIAVADDLEFEVSLSSSRCGSPSLLIKELKIAGK